MYANKHQKQAIQPDIQLNTSSTYNIFTYSFVTYIVAYTSNDLYDRYPLLPRIELVENVVHIRLISTYNVCIGFNQLLVESTFENLKLLLLPNGLINSLPFKKYEKNKILTCEKCCQ